MEASIFIILAGAAAALLMIAVEYSFVWRGFRHGDLIRILGAIFLKSPKRFFKFGLLIHGLAGVLFSVIYSNILKFFNFDTIIENLAIGAFLGVAQGFLVVDIIIPTTTSRKASRPDERPILPALTAHWVSHIIFGSALGALIGAFRVNGQQGFFISLVLIIEISMALLFFAQKATRSSVVGS